MRNILLIWLLFFSGLTLYAQTVDTSTYTQKIDYRLQHLSKTPITTGILYDRVFPAARLHQFNHGTQRDTSSANHLVQAAHELYSAHYTAPSSLPQNSDLSAYAQHLIENRTVPLAVLIYDFNQIDPDAITKNLLSLSNGLYYDVAGRSASPYLQKRVLVASVLTANIAAGNTDFRLPSELIFTNTTVSVSSVVVDFGNGSTQTLTPGGASVRVNYTSGGEKTLRLTVNLSNGAQQITYCRLTVSGSSGCPSCRTETVDYVRLYPPCYRDSVNAGIDFTPYESEDFSSVRGRAQVLYYYANNKTCIPNGTTKHNVTKPIIVLDGFDPGDKRPGEELYGGRLSYVDNSGVTQRLGTQLRSQNFDVVIVNFPTYQIGTQSIRIGPGIFTIRRTRDGGSDYIERNAFALIALIQDINTQLTRAGSTEKITIVGPSMGGLISRYALAYMEKHNMPHNVKLWVSFDSPHLGANIPIGAQQFLRYFAETGQTSAQKSVDDQLNNKAARQMLLHHHLANSNTAAGAPGYRDRFVQALTGNGLPGSNGFPQNLRRVAVINGAINGTKYGTGCERIMTMRSVFAAQLDWFIPRETEIIAARADVYFSGGYGNVCRTFFGQTLRDGPRIANGAAPSHTESYDIVPGGSFNTIEEVASSGSGFSNRFLGIGTNTTFQQLKSTHSFIPTKSALAFTGSNRDFSENLSGRNLVCSGETPFHAYYAPTTNEAHVLLTNAGANWVLNEISDTPTIDPLPGFAISGPDMICTGATYSISPALPQGASIAWSSNNANISINSNGVATRLNNYLGMATLTAHVTSACGNKTFIRPVRGGNFPTIPTTTSFDFHPFGYYFSYEGSNNNSSVTSYEWYLDGLQIGGSIEPSFSHYVNGSLLDGTHDLSVVAVNACGRSMRTSIQSFIINPNNELRPIIVPYPNPADGELSIVALKSKLISATNAAISSTTMGSQMASQSSSMSQAGYSQPAYNQNNIAQRDIIESDIVEAEADLVLVDSYNNILWQGKLTKGKANLSVNHLPDGMYYLRIISTGKSTTATSDSTTSDIQTQTRIIMIRR